MKRSVKTGYQTCRSYQTGIVRRLPRALIAPAASYTSPDDSSGLSQIAVALIIGSGILLLAGVLLHYRSRASPSAGTDSADASRDDPPKFDLDQRPVETLPTTASSRDQSACATVQHPFWSFKKRHIL